MDVVLDVIYRAVREILCVECLNCNLLFISEIMCLDAILCVVDDDVVCVDEIICVGEMLC